MTRRAGARENIWVAFSVTSALVLVLGPAPAEAGKKSAHGACTRSANALFSECRLEVTAAGFGTRAVCENLADAAARAACRGEVEDARDESAGECLDQRDARRELCEKIGEAAYEPDMSPALFQDPRRPTRANPYFPLAVGNRWVFAGGNERIEVEVRDQTKRIAGIDCIVANDKSFVGGVLAEDTDDWFGLRTDGSVEYCGEAASVFELFAGDDPEDLQLVSIDGSFKAGVERAKSGTLFMGTPVVDTTYRQEWFAGEAEDVGSVLSTSYRYGQNATLDTAVPRALAELMCANGDCVVIADTSTLEPDATEHKFFARGVGLFLEVDLESGVAVPLVACSHDARCAALPLP